MVSTTSNNFQFWLLTFGLVFVWIVVLSTAASATHITQKKSHVIHDKEARTHERNCKELCKQCGCMGFYCGEECICECNKENSDTECLGRMQYNAKKLNIPFQLLIQGPNSNGFVQNAHKYSQNDNGVAPDAAGINRNKRSNVVIYKPAAQNSLHHDADKPANGHKAAPLRLKRAVGQLDWFNDIANTLVRPAPLVSRKKAMNSDEVVAQPQFKRGTNNNRNEMDRSWFADNPNLLLRPAPLFKRPRNQPESDDNGNSNGNGNGRSTVNTPDSSFEAPMRAVGNLPKVFKDTLRSIQETTIGGSDAANELLGDTLRSHIQEGANVLQSQLSGDGNYEFFPGSGAIRDNIQQTLSHFFNGKREDERPAPIPERPILERMVAQPKMAGKNKFMWLRPVRFLQRVQQAIN